MEMPGKSTFAEEESRSSKRVRTTLKPGAANDCFTCQGLLMRCDRRRPYCAQCLAQGKNCSGYRTPLTWNVGVASRGKMRGLSLPIITSERVSRRSIVRARKKLPISKQTSGLSSLDSHLRPAMTSQASCSTEKETKQFSFVGLHPATSPKPVVPVARCHSAPQSDIQTSPCVRKHRRRHSLAPSPVPVLECLQGYQSLAGSANVWNSSNDYGSRNPVETSPVTAFLAASEQHSGGQESFAPSGSRLCLSDNPMTWLSGNGCDLNLNQLTVDYSGHELFPIVRTSMSKTDDLFLNQEYFDAFSCLTHEISGYPNIDQSVHHPTLPQSMKASVQDCNDPWTLGSSQTSSMFAGQRNSLPALIDYYENVVPPTSVTFGSLSHSHKAYVLCLAINSEALQHAIAALSANYMRQREALFGSMERSKQTFSDFFHDEFVREYSFEQNTLDAGRNQTAPIHFNGNPAEEFFKDTSCNLLIQLSLGMIGGNDDSLRAAILILCLNHVCRMGLDKLKRQFVEVAKILSCYSESSMIDSKTRTWLAVIFTWFDTTALTGKENPSATNTIGISSNEESWRFKKRPGWNSELFNVVGRLRQLQSIMGDPIIQGSSSLQADGPSLEWTAGSMDGGFDYYRMNPNQACGLQTTPLLDSESDRHEQIWRPGHEIYVQLENQQWEPHIGNYAEPKVPPLRQVPASILADVSEAFRYAALLYLQCSALSHVAGPRQIPVQTLVAGVSYHVSQVQTDVLLLLPLFITDLESSGYSSQQTGCFTHACWDSDMQEDSEFLRSVSAIEMLQHLWTEGEQ